jgi:cyclic beta-1,2-glucan synthetase
VRLPELVPTRPMWVPLEGTPPVERPTDLLFDNGIGGFTPDGREYVIYLRSGEWTPVPWSNVVANPELGFIATESGSAYTWAVNSGENRLTPWSNDVVSDPPGEAIYLRDEETGQIWSPTPLPARADAPYLVRHGAGYTVYEHNSHRLKQQLTLSVAPEDPVKLYHLRLENTSDAKRRITATLFASWVLGTNAEESRPFVIPEFDGETQALLGRNPYNAEFGERVAFAASSNPLHGMTGDRVEFLGRLGELRHPAALDRVGLDRRFLPGFDPCAALTVHIDLDAGETQDVWFLLGQGRDREHALDLVRHYRRPEAARAALDDTVAFWEDLLGRVTVETPDRAMDVMLNRWLLYQGLSARIWGPVGLLPV